VKRIKPNQEGEYKEKKRLKGDENQRKATEK
jgi:hypothetical protein